MKRLVSIILSVLMVLSLSACGGAPSGSSPSSAVTTPPAASPAPDAGSDAPPAEVKGEIVWGVAALGSSAQMVASAIGTVMTEKNPGVQVSVQATAGSNENVRLIKDGEITIANVNDGYNAVTAQGAYEGETPATLWALFNMYTNAYVVCVPANSPVKSLDDLAGKKVSLGPAGSGVYQAAYALFEAHGLIDKIQIETYSYNDANDALMDGSIDALVGLISGDIPSPALAQLDTSMELRVLEIDSEKIKSAYEKYPDYADGSISAGCIGAVKADMKVMAGFTIEYADANLSDEMAYAFVKTIYENVDTLGTYHQIAGKLSPDTALEGIPSQIPVHPGAAKYYKEAGVWKDHLTVATR